MLPIVALVGRPNVGKSTLFNTLTGTRDAIVADVPGVTRDRQYGYARAGDKPCVVVDTGGVVARPRTTVEQQMRAQTERAIEEADRLINHDTVAGHRYHDAILPTIDTEEFA